MADNFLVLRARVPIARARSHWLWSLRGPDRLIGPCATCARRLRRNVRTERRTVESAAGPGKPTGYRDGGIDFHAIPRPLEAVRAPALDRMRRLHVDWSLR